MADVQPLRALRYDLRAVGSLDAVVAPPYDVIDDAMRAELVARSPLNVVEVDLPRGDGVDPYLHAQTTLEAWSQQGIVVRDREPAIWAMTQEYSVSGTGERRTRSGYFCRVRVEDYGPGRIRPHERTHSEAREDRLRLQRATRANLSPIFSLYPDPEAAVWRALEPAKTNADPDATVTDTDGTITNLWRIADETVIAAVTVAMHDRELLIADGHHRYETARVYADEVGGEGEHSYVLMFLCSLSDPGLSVLPTHRLLSGLDERKGVAIAQAIRASFDYEEVELSALAPEPGPGVVFGYIDSFHCTPYRVTLTDTEAADRAMPDKPEPYRALDTAVLESMILRDALGMSADDISHQRGLAYSKDARDAVEALEAGDADAAFLVAPTPVERVRQVAEAGEPMPPKSTFFYPKVPTGLLFNPLE
ncbi:MAG: DUF1015 domain-containing protein [Thermoleophilaceae bacterium]|nr:DUF1015 domain-containing protein [Thermoleophilaceae bacterium]